MCLYYWQYDVLLFLIKKVPQYYYSAFSIFSVTEFFGLNNLFFIIIRRYISYLCDITMWLFSSTIHIIYNYFTIRQIEVSCFFIELKLFILNSFTKRECSIFLTFIMIEVYIEINVIKTYYLFRIFLVGYY